MSNDVSDKRAYSGPSAAALRGYLAAAFAATHPHLAEQIRVQLRRGVPVHTLKLAIDRLVTDRPGDAVDQALTASSACLFVEWAAEDEGRFAPAPCTLHPARER